MATFPTLSSGATLKYPVRRTVRTRSTVAVFVDLSEQRFAKGIPLAEFDFTWQNLSTDDKDLIRAFFRARRGADDTTWSITFEDPPGTPVTYQHLQFVSGQQFEPTMTGPNRWSVNLKANQTRT